MVEIVVLLFKTVNVVYGERTTRVYMVSDLEVQSIPIY